MASLRDFGIDTEQVRDFLKLEADKPVQLRILERDKTPAPFETKDGRVVNVLGRFLVELNGDNPTTWTWDITSRKLMSRLGALESVDSWFTVTKSGKGKLTTYRVEPVNA